MNRTCPEANTNLACKGPLCGHCPRCNRAYDDHNLRAAQPICPTPR